MEKLLEQAAQQVPSLVVLVVIVVVFLRHLAERDKVMLQLHAEHEEALKASRDVIKENTAAFAVNTEVLREVVQELRRK